MDMHVQDLGQAQRQAEQYGRGSWGEYLTWPQWVSDLKRDAVKAGAWSVGIEGDRGSYVAVNCDVYGWAEIGGDCLALVQVRQTIGRKNRYPRVLKNWLLIGRNENGAAFSHGVPSPRRSAEAMASPEAAVRWILARHVWRCAADDLEHIVRQGDVALIPVRRMPGEVRPIEGGMITLRGSHAVRGDLYRTREGCLYARGVVTLDHKPGEHRHVRTKKGLWEVRVGRHEGLWGFATDTID